MVHWSSQKSRRKFITRIFSATFMVFTWSYMKVHARIPLTDLDIISIKRLLNIKGRPPMDSSGSVPQYQCIFQIFEWTVTKYLTIYFWKMVCVFPHLVCFQWDSVAIGLNGNSIIFDTPYFCPGGRRHRGGIGASLAAAILAHCSTNKGKF